MFGTAVAKPFTAITTLLDRYPKAFYHCSCLAPAIVMSSETQTPTAAKLRHAAAAIASDVAHSPMKSRNHEAILCLNAELLALEKTMADTSDIITTAISHTQNLVMEAHRWQSVHENGQSLRRVLDQSLESILGLSESSIQEKTAVVSSESAHPWNMESLVHYCKMKNSKRWGMETDIKKELRFNVFINNRFATLGTWYMLESLLGRFVPLLFQSFPDDRKREALKSVGDDSSAKTATKQANDTVCIEHHPNCLHVRNRGLICLLSRLNHTQTITATIRHDGRSKTYESVTPKLEKRFIRLRFWDIFLQRIKSKEPGETSRIFTSYRIPLLERILWDKLE